MGVLLIAIGVLLFSGRLARLAGLGSFIEATDVTQEIFFGQLILIGVVLSLLIGLVPAFIARQKGKNFMDWWFLSSGASLVVIVLLYFLGVFNFLIPLLT